MCAKVGDRTRIFGESQDPEEEEDDYDDEAFRQTWRAVVLTKFTKYLRRRRHRSVQGMVATGL